MSGRARCGSAGARSHDEGSSRANAPAARDRDGRAALRSLQRTLGNRGMGSLIKQASAGRPLDPATLANAEERFGHGFEHVRVHDDEAAHAAAAGLGARAFTYGADVFLGAGEQADGRLLDHELAHVVQQARGGPRPPALDPGAPEERAAERAAEPGARPVEVEGATSVGVARQAPPGAALRPEELRNIQTWLEGGTSAGGSAEGTPPAPSAAISYAPTPDAFPGYQLYYVFGDQFFAGKSDFTPVKPYKSKYYWLIPQLRRTDPVTVFAYVAYNPEAERNELILDPRMLPFFFENEFLFRAIAGASYPFVGEPEAYEVQSARSVLSVMHGDFGRAARHYGAAVPNALASRKFWTQTITSTAPLLKGAPAPAPVRPPPTVMEVPPVAELPPVAPAPKTVPIVVEGGATTSGGLSTVSRPRPVVVEQPVQAPQGTARASGGTLQQSAVTPRTDVPLSRQGTWTTDPQRVISGLPPGEEVTAASLKAAGRAPTPGAVEGIAGWLAGTAAQSVRLAEERTPRLFPAPSEQERGPRLFPAPPEQGRDPRLFPALSERDPTAERLFPGAPRESDDPSLFPAPMSPVRDPLRDYMELAAGAPSMSRRRDRRTGKLRELGIAEYREHTYADRRDDALEGHEIVQNSWLEVNGYTSERGTGMASRWNPTIALPPEVHRAVSAYQAALGLYDRKALKKMGYQEMLDLNELALREGLRDSGYAEATINRVVKQATQEAWEHAIFTSAKGKRRK